MYYFYSLYGGAEYRLLPYFFLKTGKTLSEVASTQGISATQLQTIISNAITSNMQTAINNGTLTQKQVNAIIKRFENKPQTLDSYLGGNVQKAQGTPTPTITSNQ